MAFAIGQAGIELIQSFESCSLTAYQGEGEEYLTIGWGHYGADVYEGMTITQEEADALFVSDLERFVNSTNEIAVTKFPDMNQNQFDALVSYCYNRGEGRTDGSNGLRQLIYNSDTLDEVSENFLVYWGTNTAVQAGLMRRRQAEKDLFDTPVDDSGGGESGGETEPTEPTEPVEDSILSLISDTPYKINQLTAEQQTLLDTLVIGDKVLLRFSFNHNKKQVGRTFTGKRLTFTTFQYIIESVERNGFLKLSKNHETTCIFINPKYVKGVNA